jgi:deazaflavin-dependent oxidoreductase (nitroreductase family)
MTTRHSAAFYRLMGIIAVSRPVTRLHPHLYRLTGGRWLFGRNLGVLNVIVITTGRRTGKSREIPLYAFEDGPSLVVIGSNAGGVHEPAWVGNLRARPDAHVLVGREERAVRARETEGAERSRLWALAARGYPGYELYARRTHRHIPVIALDPVAAAEAPNPDGAPEPVEA